MRRIILIICCLLGMATITNAVDVQATQRDLFGLDGLKQQVPDDATKIMPDITVDNPGNISDGMGDILSAAIPQAGSALLASLRIAVAMMAVVLLCAVVSQMEATYSQNAVRIAGVLAVTLLSISSLHSMVGLGKETLQDLQSFTALLLPVLSAATAASGGAVSSSAIYVATVFVTNLLISFINHFLVPMVYAFLALSAAGSMLGNQTLKRLKDLCKWAVTNSLKLVVFLFTAYLGLSGIISGASDEAAVKAAKLAMSSMIPVVGGMISDASETVLVSAQLLKSAAGVFGMLVVLAICLMPLIRLGLQYLVLKITSAVCGTVGDRHLTDLIESVADTMGFLMGMTGACGFMLLISCVCSIKAVNI